MIRSAKGLLGALLLGAAVALAGCSKEPEQVLYLYNWSEYMPQEVLDAFREETGIRVAYTTYDSNEAMYARLRLLDDSNAYDLAVPSTYYVNKMRNEGLLQPVDKQKLTRFANLDPQLLDQGFDPQNQYSVPYLWGSTGMAVNGAAVSTDGVTKWADLWDPKYKGRVLLTNDVREVFHIGLRVLGYSGNSTSEEEIAAAYEKLRELMPSVRAFNSDAPRMPYLEGEADIGLIWNGEAVMAQEELPELAYVYPEEGAVIWVDNFVIPKNARNVEAAHKFIDFVLQPEVAAQISEEIGYATPNLPARELLPPEVRENRTSYPTEDDLENAEFQSDVGEALLVYERYWELLKAGH
ncbi:spermidine/putrescine ABC transporter substrate-binding protein [Alcanivorax sp. S71-1-4]|jgi:spermidine/putrescine transport system substrate-binding protein|uniref:extracellular solute-binding protein n=1 Tax=Alcanivorax sp. S71-1-4 TaxID=1177159 RepID=UPI0013599518|nr:extracellular solute-binding protein [Alcanivorax sp. S71-1-4]KAF0808662.1 spermidine/putrescine ABC transporter substrate-binding protein [Alcanivorax sp. S71-1-4]